MAATSVGRCTTINKRGLENGTTGKMKEAEGKFRGDLGKATGDTSEHVKGRAEEAKGKIQKVFGKTERRGQFRLLIADPYLAALKKKRWRIRRIRETALGSFRKLAD